MEIGRLGVWTFLEGLAPPEAASFAKRVESWGYSTLWLPEAVGRHPFVTIAWLAAQTSRLVLATGIANIYARDPMSTRAGRDSLAELSGGRFVLGLGVSHAPMVSGLRGHDYGKPVSSMRRYLEAMEAAVYQAPQPKEPAPVVLAALRPKMLALAAERTRGAHPYFMTPEHTARAREILGSGPWLCPEQKVLLETDAGAARRVARQAMQIYLGLANYRNALRWLGFEEADFADGGSDRLVDAIVAWGDEDAIRRRIREHHEAGADHVCIQPLRPDGKPGPDEKVLELLAPGS